jgi:hypothetical protein
MNMKKIAVLLFIAFCAVGCELWVIGTKREKPVEVNQESALGAIYLFKAELDSNNIPAATQIMARPKGKPYLAVEKYDMYYELERLRRLIGQMPITYVVADSAVLTKTSEYFSVQFDYLYTFIFTTEKINNSWYITSYKR